MFGDKDHNGVISDEESKDAVSQTEGSTSNAEEWNQFITSVKYDVGYDPIIRDGNYEDGTYTPIAEVVGSAAEVGQYVIKTGTYQITGTITYTTPDGTFERTYTYYIKVHKAGSSIVINKDLSKEYDGKPVEITLEDVTVEGSTGEISFGYEKWDGKTWNPVSGEPTEPGKYRVTITVSGDENRDSMTLDPKEFTITPNDSREDHNTTTEVPMTGDTANGMVLVLFMASLLGVVFMGVVKKRS